MASRRNLLRACCPAVVPHTPAWVATWFGRPRWRHTVTLVTSEHLKDRKRKIPRPSKYLKNGMIYAYHCIPIIWGTLATTIMCTWRILEGLCRFWRAASQNQFESPGIRDDPQGEVWFSRGVAQSQTSEDGAKQEWPEVKPIAKTPLIP